MRIIPYSRQDIDEDDIKAVAAVLRSEFITQGPSVPAFEAALATYCGVPHAIAASSGTACLHLACMALGIGVGDRVWTSPISFVASANCARYVGADVDFVDIDPATGNMDPGALEEKLKKAASNGKLPKLLIVVHFSGRSCDMARIGALAKHYGVTVLEDAAHALGAMYQGRPVGNCAHSDVTLLSFHPVKSITTGEGGALMVKDKALAEKIRLLRSHGITRAPEMLETKDSGGWYYEMQELGYHYRLTDIQAALGVSQMKKLDRFIAHRRVLAEGYGKLLANLPLDLPPPDSESAWHLYVVHLQASVKKSRKDVFEQLRARGIGAGVHYIPIHLQPYYYKLGFRPGDFPCAEAFYETALTLPLFPGLTDEEQGYVVQVLSDILP